MRATPAALLRLRTSPNSSRLSLYARRSGTWGRAASSDVQHAAASTVPCRGSVPVCRELYRAKLMDAREGSGTRRIHREANSTAIGTRKREPDRSATPRPQRGWSRWPKAAEAGRRGPHTRRGPQSKRASMIRRTSRRPLSSSQPCQPRRKQQPTRAIRQQRSC